MNGASGAIEFQDSLDRSTAGMGLGMGNFWVDPASSNNGKCAMRVTGSYVGGSGLMLTDKIEWKSGAITDPTVPGWTLAQALIDTVPKDKSLLPLICQPGYREVGPACQACELGKYGTTPVPKSDGSGSTSSYCVNTGPVKFAPNAAISADGILDETYSCPVRSQYQKRDAELTSMSISLLPQEGATSKADCTCEKGSYLGVTGASAYSSVTDGGNECKKCPATAAGEGAVCEGEYFPPIARIGYGLLDSVAATGGSSATQPPGHRAFIQCRHGSTTCKTIEDAQVEAAEQSKDLNKKVEWCIFRKPGGGASTDPADENFLAESDPKCYCLSGSIDEPEACCDCIGGRHVAPFTDVSAEVARCGPGYKDGTALCALCDTGYASVAGVCTKCGDKAVAILLPFILFPVILLVIQRVTGHFESTEISLAFLQFLGVFAGFGVRWTAAFQEFLSGFAIANVDVDLLGLACGEIDFQTMWTIQAILLPLLYVAFVIFDVALSYLLLQAAKARFPPVMLLIKKGWRPTRSFALSSISDRYMPHGLMYLNIYYLTGVSKALVLLQCETADDGSKPYLAADPTLPCWEGTHARMMGLNFISLLLYVVLVPLGYSYILFRRCPKEGLKSPRLARVFGFLWNRFEDRCWWWEVAEITLRKLPLVIISIFIPGAQLLRKHLPCTYCVLSLTCVYLCYALTTYQEPSTSAWLASCSSAR